MKTIYNYSFTSKEHILYNFCVVEVIYSLNLDYCGKDELIIAILEIKYISDDSLKCFNNIEFLR